ncbi:MAG: hypothetical protein IPK94_05000 [Saprospiraceae bacterium]|nr:hypothetical protein [Saprospiraceae bacterium]
MSPFIYNNTLLTFTKNTAIEHAAPCTLLLTLTIDRNGYSSLSSLLPMTPLLTWYRISL